MVLLLQKNLRIKSTVIITHIPLSTLLPIPSVSYTSFCLQLEPSFLYPSTHHSEPNSNFQLLFCLLHSPVTTKLTALNPCTRNSPALSQLDLSCHCHPAASSSQFCPQFCRVLPGRLPCTIFRHQTT